MKRILTGMRGFTLLEIMIAMAILTVGMSGVTQMLAGARSRGASAQRLTTATMLARTKIAETILKIEKDLERGSFPASSESDSGTFTGHDRFRYEVTIRKIKIPQMGGLGGEGGEEEGGGGNPMANIMKMFKDQLKLEESVREVTVKVFWQPRSKGGDEDSERNLSVTTHVVKL